MLPPPKRARQKRDLPVHAMLQAFAVMLDKYVRTLRVGGITPCITTWAVALQTGPVQLLSKANTGHIFQ
jgi:ABC-type uncharacterized transport system YnjBCD permease subunit